MGMTRRGFIGGAVAGLAAAPAAARQAAERLAAGRIGSAQGLGWFGMKGDGIGVEAAGEPVQTTSPKEALESAAYRAWNRHNIKRGNRMEFRIDGLDPDLWVLHSTSPLYRMQKQRVRDLEMAVENQTLYEKVRKLRGW